MAALLLADLYHLRVNGEDIPAVLDRVHGRTPGHVQVADAGHGYGNEPGTGTSELDGWVGAAAPTRLQGWIGLEYAPLDTTASGLARLG